MDTEDNVITVEIPLILIHDIRLNNQGVSTFWLAVEQRDLAMLLHKVDGLEWKIYSSEVPLALESGVTWLLLAKREAWNGKVQWFQPRKYRLIMGKVQHHTFTKYQYVDYVSPKFYVGIEGLPAKGEELQL
jgi:hypothetical protein